MGGRWAGFREPAVSLGRWQVTASCPPVKCRLAASRFSGQTRQLQAPRAGLKKMVLRVQFHLLTHLGRRDGQVALPARPFAVKDFPACFLPSGGETDLMKTRCFALACRQLICLFLLSSIFAWKVPLYREAPSVVFTLVFFRRVRWRQESWVCEKSTL